jgi:NitT/TauT family transport system permease protein
VKRRLRSLLFLAILVALWEAVARAGIWPRALFPTPLEVLSFLGRALGDGTLLTATLVTLRRLVLGYALGLLLGVPLGIVAARSVVGRDTLGFVAMGLQALPSVCWLPMALLWFGQTESAMLFVVVMGTVWSILLAASDGLRSVPPIYVRAARTMGSKGLHTWIHVALPSALPFFVTGMKQGWAFAWRSLMAAEIFVTILTGFGLGQLLHYGRELHAMDQVLGVMVVIVAVGLLVDRLLFGPLERFLHTRWGTG